MANRDGRRRFGNIRKRASGRFQVRYPGPDGRMVPAPQTFGRKSDAERYLSLVEAQIVTGDWTNPVREKIKLADYAESWISERAGLRPRTVELYRWLFSKYIDPHFGGVALGKLSTAMVREWRAKLLQAGVSQTQVAKSYRLLRAILMTAVDEDKILSRNPCRVKGAGTEQASERPVLSVAQVFELADRVGIRPVGNVRKVSSGAYRLRFRAAGGPMRTHTETFVTRAAAEQALWELAEVGSADTTRDDRLRALVLLAAFASLRWGEVTALRRRDIDLTAGTVRVRAAYTERRDGTMLLGPPKSRAGLRTVSVPASIIPDIKAHLDKYAKPAADALVFTGVKGGPLRRSGFNKLTRWGHVVRAMGVPGLHFHDLRHTGNTLAADQGASLRNLMARMGHDNERAALIYQHASRDADRRIADGLDRLVTNARCSEPSEVAEKPADGDPGGQEEDDDGDVAGSSAPVA